MEYNRAISSLPRPHEFAVQSLACGNGSKPKHSVLTVDHSLQDESFHRQLQQHLEPLGRVDNQDINRIRTRETATCSVLSAPGEKVLKIRDDEDCYLFGRNYRAKTINIFFRVLRGKAKGERKVLRTEGFWIWDPSLSDRTRTYGFVKTSRLHG